MSCFRIPTSLCKELEGICAKFWWEGSNANKGLHWKSWETLCKKKEEGGLGFKRLVGFNQALIAKQVWRMVVYPDSLVAQLFKARYFRSQDIMQAGLGANTSFVWRSMCWGRELLKEGLCWSVANERDIDAGLRNWFASWEIHRNSLCVSPHQKVSSYIDSNGTWLESQIRRDFLPFEAEEILKTRIFANEGKDHRF